MRKLIPLLALILFCALPAHATIAEVHHTDNTSCSAVASSCAITVTSTGAGHFGVCIGMLGSTATVTLSNCSGGGTWTTPSGCATTLPTSTLSTGCSYNTALTTGTTTVTCNWSTAAPGAGATCGFLEFSFTASSIAIDTTGARVATPAAANVSGVALTLSGTNDVIVQFGAFTGAASASAAPYNVNGTFPSGNAEVYAVNISSGAANTYTNSSSNVCLGAIALKEVTGGTPVRRRGAVIQR